MRHCDPVTMDHIIELRKRVALLEKQLENALAWVTAKQREEAVARDVLKEMRKALERIADSSNWGEDGGWDADSYPDEIAREALKEKE